MIQSVSIGVDEKASNLVLKGNIGFILENKRLLSSFKRLNYKHENNTILVPYPRENQAKVLQEIEELFDYFNLPKELSEEMKKSVSSYHREQENFQEFSEKARAIRNYEFKDRPELLKEFENFTTLISKTFKRQLYKLQLLSAYHLAFSQNACNFSVPGAGKTSIVYGAYAYLKALPEDDPRHVDKLLIIGPLASFAPWESEYRECFGTTPSVKRLSGDSSILRQHKEQHLYSGKPAEITLIFYDGVDSLQKEIIAFLKANKTMVVVDEAHRVKNPDGIWGKSVVEIAKEAKARVILTGTPVPNGYQDLYNLYQFLYPYKYKDILKVHYVNLADMTKNNEPDDQRVKEFTNNISPYFIRIKKADLHLPPIEDNIVNIPMGERQREIYDFIETKYVRSFERNSSATVKDFLNKAKLVRLRQAATNPSLLRRPIEETLDSEDFLSTFGGSADGIPEEYQDDSQILSKIRAYTDEETPQKFERIRLLLANDIINKGQKAIIWTIFIQNAKQLEKYLTEHGIASRLLIGEIEQGAREITISKFNDPSNQDFQVVIANPFAVGESISLHKGCHNAIYMERDYNCSNFLQSKDRIHRVGLHSDQITRYFYILSEDSIDGVIDECLAKKVKRMEAIIDQEIPLFVRINDADETDLVKALIDDYARRT